MKAKITIEWENGITFVAEHAEMEHSDLELHEQPAADHISQGNGMVVYKIDHVDMSLNAKLLPAPENDELYRYTDISEKKR